MWRWYQLYLVHLEQSKRKRKDGQTLGSCQRAIKSCRRWVWRWYQLYLVHLEQSHRKWSDRQIPEPFLYGNSSDTVKPTARGNTEVHAFSKDISLKMNFMALVEFEHAYYFVTIEHASLYTTKTSSSRWSVYMLKILGKIHFCCLYNWRQ